MKKIFTGEIKKNLEVLKYFLKKVRSISKSYLPILILSSFFKSVSPFLNIIIPKFIIDELLNKQRTEVFVLLIALLIGGNFVFNIINKFFDYLIAVKNIEVIDGFYDIINAKVVDMDFENVEDPEVLDLKERALFAINNEGAIRNLIEDFSSMISQAITIAGLAFIISILNPFIIVLIFIIIALNTRIYAKIQRIEFVDNQRSIPSNRAFGYYGTLTADFSLGKDIRLYNMAPLILGKIRKFSAKIVEIGSNLYSTKGKYTGITNINLQLQIAIVYGYLCYKVLYTGLSIGNFTMYAGAAAGFTTAVSTFISEFVDIGNQCRNLQLYRDFEDRVSVNDKAGDALGDIKDYDIEFKNVSFKYPRSKDYTLKNISIKIHPGEKLSVVGRNGAGKTTFIKLLTRLYEPTEGEILLHGKNISEYDYKEYVKLLSVVFQDFKLFAFTIKENLTLDDSKNIVDRKIIEILEQAGLEEDFKKLPKGLETSVYKNFDQEGIEFSGGQSQKLAIARAIYKDAPIIVLDEPTAALDPISEYEIYQRFDKLVGNKTAVYISHRLSSCKFCDKIAVFDNGTIVQYGSHDELIQDEDKQYAKMYNAQAKYYV